MRVLKHVCSTFFCFILCSGCFLCNVRAVPYKVNVKDALIVRKGPSIYSEFLGSLSNEAVVDVLEVKGDWGKINYNGQTAWICLKFASLFSSEEKKEPKVKEYAVKVEDSLMLREDSSTSSKVLFELKNGTVLKITHISGEWGKTTYSEKSGWVCMRFLKELNSSDDTVSPVEKGTSIITQKYLGDKHKGIDIGSYGGKNIDIFAVKKGLVKEAVENGLYNGGMGNYIYIKHDEKYVSKYFHLKSLCVKPGSQVEKGQKIGVMGTTGRSTGVHLHFQVELDGKHVNPRTFVDPLC